MFFGQAPFSGDVSQAINPWTSVFRSIGNQVGLINVYMGRTSKPDVEQKILDEVGSYGRQLGRIGDALEVVLKHVKIDNPTEEESAKLYLLRQQIKEINKVKKLRDPD